MFKGRSLLIASRHAKEKVIAPLFSKALGVVCQVAEKFDTDALGTFSGEILRKDTPLATARAKCMQAMEMYNADLGIASEGSFGAHPHIPLLHANQEWLICIDRKHAWESWVQTISLETNFDGQEIEQWEQLRVFAKRVGFPYHALILRTSPAETAGMLKGITTWHQLRVGFRRLQQAYGKVYVETDMRAMHNPSRMKLIGSLAQKLLEQIRTPCPACRLPGFSLRQAVPGLPCRQCSAPSNSALYHVYACQGCGYQHMVQYPHGTAWEEAMYCQSCNP